MAVSARRVSKAVNSKRTNWEEDECWWYYNMLPLHQVFEIVGSQLNENDVRVLSCLLEETEPQPLHPLHPTLWSVDRSEEETDEEVTANFLTSWWENKQRRSRIDGQGVTESNGCGEGSFTPRSGVEFLFELERRGLCDESNLRYLMQLLRILTRHDLLPYVNMKKRRTVSPERYSCGSYSYDAEKQVDECLNSASRPEQDQWRAGVTPNKRKRATRKELQQNTNGRTCDNTHQERPAQNRVTCDIRLRVRAEYCEHHSILNGSVLSVKQNPLEKQFDLFSQSTNVLKSRDLGSIICDIKFSELSYLDAFWNDYMNGSLLEALKGVFITDSLKQAVGQEAIKLMVNVDEDDYEEGRKLLLENLSQ
ncbi:DNA-binding death effector domain-containing protein 2 isoform X1 [Protopterus annectens]|uniref:DNA-binding death effector domain-containing protein 2 isoform X1 n=1 Tax=Protopterus annectens TaxID=7888 RepID=UPI001CFA2B14|nr:DNA-binding death effector domain-containing protein 2 isoform X1 [Protopterus annectens]